MVEGFAAHWLGRGEVHDEAIATRTLTQLWVRGLGMPARIAAASGHLAGPGRSAAPAARPTSPAQRQVPSKSARPTASKEPR